MISGGMRALCFLRGIPRFVGISIGQMVTHWDSAKDWQPACSEIGVE
jgi:hypothetical protein